MRFGATAESSGLHRSTQRSPKGSWELELRADSEMRLIQELQTPRRPQLEFTSVGCEELLRRELFCERTQPITEGETASEPDKEVKSDLSG